MEPEIRSNIDVESMSHDAARFILDVARARVGASGQFTLVLSGGETPRGTYRSLASPPLREAMPWRSTHVFWGDERCVPPDHSSSNFAMAHEALLSRVPVPEKNVHRIPAELEPPRRAATVYEQALREVFVTAVPPAEEPFPAFDLILLGMGPDGHTASLFPESDALDEQSRWVVSVDGSKAEPPVPRITITLPVINAARNIAFLVSGEKKREVVHAIWNDREKAMESYPAARVGGRGRVIWFSGAGI